MSGQFVEDSKPKMRTNWIEATGNHLGRYGKVAWIKLRQDHNDAWKLIRFESTQLVRDRVAWPWNKIRGWVWNIRFHYAGGSGLDAGGSLREFFDIFA